MYKFISDSINIINQIIKSKKMDNNIQKLKLVRSNLKLLKIETLQGINTEEEFEDYQKFMDEIYQKIVNNDECFKLLQNLLVKLDEID